jgi:hypothetical protein
LTPHELGQSLEDFCRDLQNGTQRAQNLDEDGSVGSRDVHLIEGDDQSASAGPEIGRGFQGGREGGVEKIVANVGVGNIREASITPNLSGREEDKGTVYPPLDKDQNHPHTGHPKDLSLIHDSYPPAQHLNSPKESLPNASPDPFTEEQRWLAELLKPVSEFNARTPWPIPFRSDMILFQYGTRSVQRATSLQLLLDLLREGSISRALRQPTMQILHEKSMDILVSTLTNGTDVAWASVEDARYVVQAYEHDQQKS